MSRGRLTLPVSASTTTRWGKATVEVGQTLSTETGKAEMLLTPGVFLREGDHTSVKMVAAGLANTELNVTQGHAMIEVDQIYPQNNIRIHGRQCGGRIMKPGLYDFDLQQNELRCSMGRRWCRKAIGRSR